MTIAFFPLPSDPPFSSTFAGIEIALDEFNHIHVPSPFPPASYPYPSYSDDSDNDDEDSSDDDDHNYRVAPHWPSYRHLIESRGYHLDTCQDVRQFYLRYWESRKIQRNIEACVGYRSACREGRGDNELCKDDGLVSSCLAGLFYFFCSRLPVFLPRSVFDRLTTIILHSRSACSEANDYWTTSPS